MSVWGKRISKAEKFLEPAQTHGRKVYARYQDKRDDVVLGIVKANLFYANVNTIKESLFNSLPKPDVSRLHKGEESPPARVAALILQRALHYEVNCMTAFEESVKAAILERLVPGIGQIWLRFDMADQTAQGTEQIIMETVYWEDFIYDPKRQWSQVNWVGRKLNLTKREVMERWGEGALTQLEMVKQRDNVTPKEINADKYCVYELWDKTTKEVVFWATGDVELERKPDPYQLKGFFPCPCPLIANPTTTALLPVTDYHIAQDQYNQLDVLYARIGLIIKAVKVAGVYDAQSTEIGRMLEGQENKLVPVDNWAMYAERGGAKGMIDWYPVDTIVSVLETLLKTYESIKAMLFEITGMSDIIRGATNQYETAAAQQIKAQYASVRMNGYQRNVAEFVRGALRIMAEMVTQLYSDQKLAAIVGDLSPADMAVVPQAMQILRSDLLTQYKVDIEADSLTQADWALEKTQRADILQAISQFLQSAGPMIQQAPQMAPLMLALFKFTVGGFKGASEIEGQINQLFEQAIQQAQQPQEPKPSPEELKAQAEMARMQAEQQMEQQRFQADMALEQQKAQSAMQIEQAQAQADLAIKQAELAFKERVYEMDLQMKQMEFDMKKRLAELDFALKTATTQMNMEQKANETVHNEIVRVGDREDRDEERESAAEERREEREDRAEERAERAAGDTGDTD